MPEKPINKGFSVPFFVLSCVVASMVITITIRLFLGAKWATLRATFWATKCDK